MASIDTVRFDLNIDQGATFQHIIYLTDAASNPVDLTGYTTSSQMKRWYTSLNSISLGATINATAGTITLAVAPANTATIVSGRYVYDVLLADPSNTVTRVLEGQVIVSPGVTNMNIETTPNTYNANVDFTVVPLIG